MSVATPPPSIRPPAEPDWSRWEAELEQARLGDAGPPAPPEPPARRTGGGGGGGGDDDENAGDGRAAPQGAPRHRPDLTWLGLLLGAVALLLAVTFVSAQQPERFVPTNPEPVSAQELYQSKTAHTAGPRPHGASPQHASPPTQAGIPAPPATAPAP